MNPKKSKEKERRRARKLADEAWEAADAGNLDLAEKIIRRAVETQIDNPVLHNDRGMLLTLRGNPVGAEDAFRAAIALAPTYAEPCAHLAAMEARHGYLREAVHWMERAVQHAPQTPQYAERLEAYRALLAASERTEAERPAETVGPAAAPAASPLAETLAGLDWAKIGEQLTREGCVKIEAVLDPANCAELRALFDDDTRFAKTVNMDREDFGKGAYRYFQAPLPGIVDALRRGVYPHVARIANEWQRLLNDAERFPEEWEVFREQCAAAGQTVPTPILLRYQAGGFNALHRDLRGSVFFPIQMAVVLSPRGWTASPVATSCSATCRRERSRGGARSRQVWAMRCCSTRDRLARVGGALRPAAGQARVTAITEGTRVVPGVPFHEYR